jgi:hypothetical protein
MGGCRVPAGDVLLETRREQAAGRRGGVHDQHHELITASRPITLLARNVSVNSLAVADNASSPAA